MKDYLLIAANCWIGLGLMLDLMGLVVETDSQRGKHTGSGIPMVVTLLLFYVPGVQFRQLALHGGYSLILWLLLVGVSCHVVLPTLIAKLFPGKKP